jgi:hypothetical protein
MLLWYDITSENPSIQTHISIDLEKKSTKRNKLQVSELLPYFNIPNYRFQVIFLPSFHSFVVIISEVI